MKHIIKKIWEDTNQLTDLDKKHLEECDLCKKEYLLAKKIESSIEKLPELNVPIEVDKIIAKVLLKPFYRTWQLILIGLWVVLSPFLLQLNVFSVIILKSDEVYAATILFVLIYMILILAFGYHFYTEHKKSIEEYSQKIDLFLENKLMKIQK